METQERAPRDHGPAYRFVQWCGEKLARVAGIEEPCPSNTELTEQDYREYRKQLASENSQQN